MYALVLQNMGDPTHWREAIADFELAIPRYATNVRSIVHDVALPLPGYIRTFPFDLIIINSTVLGAVTNHRTLASLRQRLAFLANSPSYKIALPQDDYYCSEELDRLMVEWGIDTVHTVCPQDWEVLYPRFLARGGDLRLGYTGYVTPRMRTLSSIVKPRHTRRLDVVYRAAGRPGFPNRMALVKAELGRNFVRSFGSDGWKLDITTDDTRVITGRAWWDFLADSRMTLGSNSGSSTLIRNLVVAEAIRDYLLNNLHAPPEEVVDACIPLRDRAFGFTAISPRVLEAALVETTQLLVPGPYSGFLHAGEHYWPLEEDCSNFDDIRKVVGDASLQDQLARRCKEVIMETKEIQIEQFISNVTSGISKRDSTVPHAEFEEIERRFRGELGMKVRAHYRRVNARYELAKRLQREGGGYSRQSPRPPAWMRAIYHSLRTRLSS